MSRPTARDSKLASLDILRGIAIISVLIAHTWPASLPAPRSLILLFGQFGVILFFFLSGFLMNRTYAEHPRLGPFVIRRLFRILPMYWASILLIFATERGWTLRDVMANAIFATGPLNVIRMSGVYWTLYIEVLFYATVPLVFLAGRRAIQFGPYVAIGLFGTLWAFGVRTGVAPHYLAYCYLGLQFGAWQRKVISSGVLVSSVATVTAAASILPFVSPFPDIVSQFLGLAPPVCAVLLYVAIRVAVRARLIEFFGHISYSLYLLHIIVISEIGNLLISDGYSRWMVAAACIGISTVFSTITFVLIERPAIGVGRQIIKLCSDAPSACDSTSKNR
jgi:peptidoglycan/LPS O-acetylase OafA/YrhL